VQEIKKHLAVFKKKTWVKYIRFIDFSCRKTENNVILFHEVHVKNFYDSRKKPAPLKVGRCLIGLENLA